MQQQKQQLQQHQIQLQLQQQLQQQQQIQLQQQQQLLWVMKNAKDTKDFQTSVQLRMLVIKRTALHKKMPFKTDANRSVQIPLMIVKIVEGTETPQNKVTYLT